MKSLSEIAGTKLEQKQWQQLKKKYIMAKIPHIEKARFQHKRNQYPAYQQSLSLVTDKSHRTLTKRVILNKMRKIYQQGIFVNLHPVPRVSREHQIEFRNRLINQSPNEVFHIFLNRNSTDYIIYYLRTPTSFELEPNAIFRVVTVDSNIIDLGILWP